MLSINWKKEISKILWLELKKSLMPLWKALILLLNVNLSWLTDKIGLTLLKKDSQIKLKSLKVFWILLKTPSQFSVISKRLSKIFKDTEIIMKLEPKLVKSWLSIVSDLVSLLPYYHQFLLLGLIVDLLTWKSLSLMSSSMPPPLKESKIKSLSLEPWLMMKNSNMLKFLPLSTEEFYKRKTMTIVILLVTEMISTMNSKFKFPVLLPLEIIKFKWLTLTLLMKKLDVSEPPLPYD